MTIYRLFYAKTVTRHSVLPAYNVERIMRIIILYFFYYYYYFNISFSLSRGHRFRPYFGQHALPSVVGQTQTVQGFGRRGAPLARTARLLRRQLGGRVAQSQSAQHAPGPRPEFVTEPFSDDHRSTTETRKYQQYSMPDIDRIFLFFFFPKSIFFGEKPSV